MNADLTSLSGGPVRVAVFGTHSQAVAEVLAALAARRSGIPPEVSEVGDLVLARVSWKGEEGQPCIARGLLEDHHPAAIDLALREVDAVLFVMDVQPDQLRAGWEKLMTVGESSRREGFELLDRPFALQYHGDDRHPGFDPDQLDAWLGFPHDRVVRGVTSSAQADQGLMDQLVGWVTKLRH
ncbi:hypothetical protein HNR46_003576 [Haloferula luteola]|uniref:Uncharacterized protein n=1 Tax=Haloferula luteola TaxID=595692 RepID=A0A840VHK6_9BACT|nr:hypothetical protein [Haloferula luteola]MBB5353320.1 hypothetical protein [Haloferula luteola]